MEEDDNAPLENISQPDTQSNANTAQPPARPAPKQRATKNSYSNSVPPDDVKSQKSAQPETLSVAQ